MGFYLQAGYAIWECQQCMENCLECNNKTDCMKCGEGYEFNGSECLDNFAKYGPLSNMSGWTSNITQITSSIYLGTSLGPLLFGSMTPTYFNIEFCQFVLFHANAADGNKEIETFLDSLQPISLTIPSNKANSHRRLLTSSLSTPLAFLATSAPIFALMGGFLALYLAIYLFKRYAASSCLNFPRFKFYATETCSFLEQRFMWIYFDFVAWISYLPFTYFSLMQLKAFSFHSFLEGISCLLAILIIGTYPLYPLLILRLLRKNYNHIVKEDNKMVEMSLTPFIYKVKRPQTEIPPEGQPLKEYLTQENIRLIYEPLKYIRKFGFAMVVALCPEPVLCLSLLIGLNVLFIAYMVGFRPRFMPYLILDMVIEGVLLMFEIFVLVNVVKGGASTTAVSITAHFIAFLTSNLSLIVAIVLNIIAYY
jgi:hypothetical protein